MAQTVDIALLPDTMPVDEVMWLLTRLGYPFTAPVMPFT